MALVAPDSECMPTVKWFISTIQKRGRSLVRAMNSLLPTSIAVSEAVSDDDARYSVTGKRYIYKAMTAVQSPFSSSI